jgi:pimeloyl-ACP methyl ester carboxylesterase
MKRFPLFLFLLAVLTAMAACGGGGGGADDDQAVDDDDDDADDDNVDDDIDDDIDDDLDDDSDDDVDDDVDDDIDDDADDDLDDDVDDDADDDVDDDVDDDIDDDVDDDIDDDIDDDADDDTVAAPLQIYAVDPARGGASVDTPVTITGDGFAAGLVVAVGGTPALNVQVLSATTATAVFPAVALTACGFKTVYVALGGQSDTLVDGFEYFFDEDPVVFVHGFLGGGGDFDTMVQRFRDLGYPDDYLEAIDFSDNAQSNVDSAQELPALVDAVLARTGRERVDLVAHSMGGLSSRLWIAQYGGGDKVRDYVSLSGTQHGNWEACLVWPFYESARELCPAYADEGQAANDVQFILNGHPDELDVDETPFGVENGGGIYYHAMWAGLDEIVFPNTSACLNQSFVDDCSDPINVEAPNTFHMQMLTSVFVWGNVRDWLRAHNISKP